MKYVWALLIILVVLSACTKTASEPTSEQADIEQTVIAPEPAAAQAPEFVDIPNLKIPEFQDLFKTLHEYSAAYALLYKGVEMQQIQSFKGNNVKFETITEDTTTEVYYLADGSYACSRRPTLECYELPDVDLGPVFNLYANPTQHTGKHTKEIQIGEEIGYCYLITGGNEDWVGCFTTDGILLIMATSDDSLKMNVLAVSREVNETEFDLPTKPKAVDVNSAIAE